jgi:prepilin-type N-terminal cleavage/methylation domain-containing protein
MRPAATASVAGNRERSAFTLIELLVVIAVIAVISVVLVVILNPAELLSESRDTNRLSDMEVIDKTISIYEAQVGGGSTPGSSSVAYISIPDPLASTTAGDQCQGLGLPTLPALWGYHCASVNNYRNVDGTGWIPINLQAFPGTNSISELPVDPKNQTSTGFYYTYTTNGSAYQLTAELESQKYSGLMASDNGSYTDLYERKGSPAANLPPIDFYAASVATSTGGFNFNVPVTFTAQALVTSTYTFAGTTGQIVTADINFYNNWYDAYIVKPDGTILASSGNQNGLYVFLGKTLPTTGTYSIVMYPLNGDAGGTATISLTSNTTNPTIAFNTPVTNAVSSASTTEMAYNFTGTSGQVISADASFAQYYNAYLLSPTGTAMWSSGNCNITCYINGTSLSSTGTYTIVVAPLAGGAGGNATISLTSNTTNPTISFGGSVTSAISTTSTAEMAYNFTGTSGQIVSAAATFTQYYNAYLLSPTGTALWATGNCNTTCHINGLSLSSVGTYTLLLIPYYNGLSGNATISLTSNTTNPTISFATPQSNSINATSTAEFAYNFAGTMSQTVSLSLYFGNWYNAFILNPNGTTLWSSGNCNGACTVSSQALSATGTSTIIFIPFYDAESGNASTTLTTP